MKKKINALLTTALAAGVLAGCGGDNSSSVASMESDTASLLSSQTSDSSDLESGAESTVSSEGSSAPESSSAVSSQVSSTVSSKPSSSSTASSKPVASKPNASSSVSSKPAESKPSVSSAAPSKPASSLTPQQVAKGVAKAYGSDYLPDMQMSEDMIYGLFSVDKNLVESAYGEAPAISANPDQLIVMKAARGKGAQLETAMNKARDQYVETAFVYPKDGAKLNASRVVRNGDYVAFIMLGAVDEANDDVTSAEAIKFAQNEVQKGVNAFNAMF